MTGSQKNTTSSVRLFAGSWRARADAFVAAAAAARQRVDCKEVLTS